FTQMYDKVFMDCVKLKNITIPDTCVAYRDYVFANTAIEEFTFSAKLTSPGGYTFTNCKSLKRVVFQDGPTSFGYYSNSNWGGRYLIQGCTALEELILPNTLQYLRSDSSGNAVFSIGKDASGVACEAYGLKKIVIPASVTTLQDKVFENVPADCQVYVRGSETAYAPLWADGWDSSLTLPVIWDYTGN
ncbi:MAG: leucine-rich repeat domain-containing protein, partial [Clostridia bacterium]|nr:leucine-rich repeat domain-containing protein [Clostridia bacterium]